MVSHRGGWCSRVLGLRSPFFHSLKLCHSSRWSIGDKLNVLALVVKLDLGSFAGQGAVRVA